MQQIETITELNNWSNVEIKLVQGAQLLLI